MAASTAQKRAGRRARDVETLPAAIRFKHKPSGKEKQVATGFAWDLFLFAGIFGLPLFWRHLSSWGAGVLVLWLLVLATGTVRIGAEATEMAQLVLCAAFLVLQIGLGFFGNRLTAHNLLHHGWVLDQPNDAGTKRIVQKWKLA